jgi:hypothetical protein
MGISWADRVKNEEMYAVKEDRTKADAKKKRNANRIGYILRRNCLLKHVIERRLEERKEVAGKLGRRRKQLLDDFAETRDTENCNRKHQMALCGESALEEAVDLS